MVFDGIKSLTSLNKHKVLFLFLFFFLFAVNLLYQPNNIQDEMQFRRVKLHYKTSVGMVRLTILLHDSTHVLDQNQFLVS